MKVLCTFPGKFGDLIWALPTVRAISETVGEPVSLQVSPIVASLAALLERQSYIDQVIVDPSWEVRDTAPMTPRIPPMDPAVLLGEIEHVFHLGYEGWPEGSLPIDVYRRAASQEALRALDLDRPWIIAPYVLPAMQIALGFTDEWFELKYGLYWLLRRRYDPLVNLSTSPRWEREAEATGYDWATCAAWLSTAKVFVGCCSALHVLACAVGTPVVCLEPNPWRHHPIFYPYGTDGRVRLVMGVDGKPTFDGRHLIDVINDVLTLPVAVAKANL